MAEDYVCTLTEDSKKVAEEDLHEDPKERMSTVAAFKSWIDTQQHIKCAADTRYILRFLRAGKFSQLLARQKLEKWLSALDIISDWIRDIDLSDPKFAEFYDTGYFVLLPGTDKHGRKICMYRPGCLDVSGRFHKNLVMKAIFAAYMWIMWDENTQVNGLMYFMDFTGFNMKQMMFFGLEDMKKMTKMWQGAFPGRFKGFHYYNTGAVFETMMAAMMPLLNKKFKERINIHGSNLENVYKVIPMEMLPDEYLPDDYEGKSAGPIKDLLVNMKKEFLTPEVINRVKFETGADFAIDASRRIVEESASFRKLNVD